MLKVQAVIREDRLEAVVERLTLLRVRGLTLGPVRGSGATGGHRAYFRGGAYDVPFVSKLQIEWIGPDHEADAVVRAILHTAATGTPGDGNVFVVPVEEAVRIRTGERGESAV